MSIFTRIFDWIKLVGNGIPKEIREYVDTALTVTGIIKEIVNSSAAIVLVDLTPVSWDNLLRQNISEYLQEIIPYLQIVKNCENKTGEELIVCFIQELQKLNPHLQNAILIKLAALLVNKQDANELKQSFYDLAVQAKITHDRHE